MLKSRSLPIFAGAAAMGALAFGSPAVHADVIKYSLTNDMCSGGCGTSPFGTVTVSSVNSTTVDVNVTLGPNNPIEVFAKTGAGNDEALEFNIASNPTLTLSTNTPPTPSGVTLSLSSPSTGEFSVTCTSCGPGTSNTTPGPLDFDLSVASGSLTPEDFTKTSGNFFTADIGTGCTGPGAHNSFTCANTGVVGAPTAVPVPAPLIGHGLLVLLAVGGALFGAKFSENLKKHHLPAV
jgi:hypothetical protein